MGLLRNLRQFLTSKAYGKKAPETIRKQNRKVCNAGKQMQTTTAKDFHGGGLKVSEEAGFQQDLL